MAAEPPPRDRSTRADLAKRPPEDEPPADGSLGALREATGRVVVRGTERVLETKTAKRLWRKVLESDEAQQLVERVAEAPEVRSAITSQGVGLLEDMRRGLRRVARRLDEGLERGARTLLRRPVRERRPIYAGAVTRLLSLLIDAGVVYGSLLLISAAIALLVSALTAGDHGAGTVVIAFGALLWLLIAEAYLVFFWSGAQRTPGMSFMGLRMHSLRGDEDIRLGQAIRRAIWVPLSVIPLGLGYRGVLFDEQRRGWPDRRAHTVVVYADPVLDKGLAGPGG
jgi:uncharacterized RDD family membrane protein YckC